MSLRTLDRLNCRCGRLRVSSFGRLVSLGFIEVLLLLQASRFCFRLFTSVVDLFSTVGILDDVLLAYT